MRPLPDRTRPIDYREAYGTDGYARGNPKANLAGSVSLLDIFQVYNIPITEYNDKCLCPLHREDTASFHFNKTKNAFYCFGCGVGGGPIEFVAAIESIEKEKAAEKLLLDFEPNPDFSKNISSDYYEKINLSLGFSKIIREFILEHRNEEGAFEHADNICKDFDTIMQKNKVEVVGIKYIIDQLTKKLNKWQVH
jgi:hypothetical protein